MDTVIRLTRLNGSEFALNPDLVHRAEATPDTVLSLVDGTRYVVAESVDELIALVVAFRARVVREAGREDPAPVRPAPVPADGHGADVVPLSSRRV